MSALYGALKRSGGGYPSRISYLIGPDTKIVNVYAQVSPASHAEEVLAELS